MKRFIPSILIASVVFAGTMARSEPDFQPVQKLLDFSGLAWLGNDRFLVVHDAKNPDELDRVRVSMLKTPVSLDGMLWAPLKVDFGAEASSDLESASRVPGTDYVLLAESNDDESEFRRIFLAQVKGDTVSIQSTISWTGFSDAFNVEATAVAETENGYVFIWAERNSGKQSTNIHWNPMTLDPFSIGAEVASVPFSLPDSFVASDGKPLYTRPLVGLDVDSVGILYGVAAFDPEGTVKNPDNGPFRSTVLQIGSVQGGDVVIDDNAKVLAASDGFKIESVAAAERADGIWLFIGTDDENYGGTLRRLPF